MMKLNQLLIGSCLFLMACNSTTIDNEVVDAGVSREVTKNTLSEDELEKFLALFPDVTSFEFNEALFSKNEGGAGGELIPIAQDIAILGTEHEGYDGTEDFMPNAFNSAVAKFSIVPNEFWGLIVMNRMVGTDGRSQTYSIYTINKSGEVIQSMAVAASLSWGGGYSYEEGSLKVENDVYQMQTVAAQCEYGEGEEKPYMAKGLVNHYTFNKDGSIEDKSIVCFLPPKSEEAALEYKTFESIELMEWVKEDAKHWKHQANLEHGIAWKDMLGLNYVFFATQNMEEHPKLEFVGKPAQKTLHATHYINKGATDMIWEMNDFEPVCEFDLFANFLYNSVHLSDVDKNGMAEISFMYSLGCISDVSPVTVKLMLYENGKKYALRGHSRVSVELEYETRNKPQYTVDKAFKEAPKAFLDLAKEQWAKYDVVY